MKKFKHKKTGEIATYKDGILKIERCCVEIGVEPSSEFWEEVVEKDYEILTMFFKRSDRPEIRSVQGYSHGYLQALLNTENCIHSVKKLSDGEVFTVGDRIDNTQQLCKNSKIENFAFDTKNNILVWVHNDKPKFKVGLTINSITKSKPVLFTTEDRVDIYEGDKLFTVEKGFYFIQEIKASKNTEELFKRRLFFSTKEAAQEFIILNKPCLSINDVNNCYTSPMPSPLHNNLTNNLKELVKSKL